MCTVNCVLYLLYIWLIVGMSVLEVCTVPVVHHAADRSACARSVYCVLYLQYIRLRVGVQKCVLCTVPVVHLADSRSVCTRSVCTEVCTVYFVYILRCTVYCYYSTSISWQEFLQQKCVLCTVPVVHQADGRSTCTRSVYCALYLLYIRLMVAVPVPVVCTVYCTCSTSG